MVVRPARPRRYKRDVTFDHAGEIEDVLHESIYVFEDERLALLREIVAARARGEKQPFLLGFTGPHGTAFNPSFCGEGAADVPKLLPDDAYPQPSGNLVHWS